LGHIQSELHMRNLAKTRRGSVSTVEIDLTQEEATDIIVVEDDSPAPSRRPICTPLTKPFRGFWSASEIVRPLASVGGCYQQIRNFGYHARPARQKRGRGSRRVIGENFNPKEHSGVKAGRVRKQSIKKRDLTAAKVTGRGIGREGWSRGDLRKWVKDTEESCGWVSGDIIQDVADDMISADSLKVTEYSNLNLEEMARRARSWASKNRGDNDCQSGLVLTKRNNIHPSDKSATDVVDLSSSDEDIQGASNKSHQGQKELDFNITNIRSLNEGPSISAINKKLMQTSVESTGSDELASHTKSNSLSSSMSSSSHDDVSAHSELRYFKTGPLASLWSYQGNVGPLISPEMGGSLKEVYNRLSMDPSVNSNYIEGFADKLLVSYDLYLAEHYKKSPRTLPNYRVIIQTFSSPFPSPASLAHLDKQYPDQVPFLFAVVSGGTVTFFSLDRVELPRYFRNV